MSWTKKALCRGMDVEIFFPERGVPTLQHRLKIRELCNECPVRLECLKVGLASDRQSGYFGGFSANQRESFISRKMKPEEILAL